MQGFLQSVSLNGVLYTHYRAKEVIEVKTEDSFKWKSFILNIDVNSKSIAFSLFIMFTSNYFENYSTDIQK